MQRELAAFMAGVNPGVRLTPIQMREIVEQVLTPMKPPWNKPLRVLSGLSAMPREAAMGLPLDNSYLMVAKRQATHVKVHMLAIHL